MKVTFTVLVYVSIVLIDVHSSPPPDVTLVPLSAPHTLTPF